MADPVFSFLTDSYPTEFIVVSFVGNERMSRLFKYEIELKMSDTIEVDEELMVAENGVFTFEYNGSTSKLVEVTGILSKFEYIRSGANHHYYRATLVPESWKDSLGIDFEIFLDMTPKDIIDEEINDAGINADTSGVLGATCARPFTCQYNESNFGFISRIAEHNGIYYYFDHEQDSKMIFADDDQYPSCMSPQLRFDAVASGDSYYNMVHNLTSTCNHTASYVSVRDSNPNQPSAEIFSELGEGDKSGYAINLVEEDVADSDEAAFIAKIRFEEIQSGSTLYEGRSGAIQLRPGYTFDLTDHPMVNKNNSYLIVGIVHEGNNLDKPASEQVTDFPYYRNTFRAIKSTVQFRPKQVTQVPKAISTLGTVYSEVGEPRLAERNDRGEYRVRFKFLNDEIESKASYWLRMGLPAQGAEDTLDIPLKGGVEVQIGFENGNPNKPYIQSAMPNAQFPSHVTANNPNNALLATSGLLGLKANGGWHRSIHVDEPDWENKQFGAEDHTFKEQINNGVNLVTQSTEDMSEQEEYSGRYNVDRSYGDTYIFVDGNTYKWDNEKAYCFGNDYEEIHEDEDGFENGEVYDMTPFMQAVGCSLEGRDYSGWQDGDDGLVEKTWGDKCEFHQGRVFCWSGGLGPGDSLETFNYGNGYTENLKEYGKGTAESNGLTTKKKDWDDYPDMIDPSQATIDKTWGNTYEYHEGLTVEVKHTSRSTYMGGSFIPQSVFDDADFVSNTYGDTKDYQDGNAHNHHTGWGYSFFGGGNMEVILGLSEDVYIGGKTSQMIGVSSETFIGGKLDFELSATQGLNAAKDFRAEVFEDKVTAKSNEAAMSVMKAALNEEITSLKSGCKTMQYEVLAGGQITLKSPMIDIIGASILLQGALMKIG